jgi:CBS domain-containing protein
MTTVRELLQGKGDSSKYSVSSQATVLEALKIMARENIGAVFVAESNRIAGIFTERDYLLKGELDGRQASSTLVKDVMTRNVYTVEMETSPEECIALMNRHHIRHLPVVEKDQLVGVLSVRDVMSAVLEHKSGTMKDLEDFMMGSGFAS